MSQQDDASPNPRKFGHSHTSLHMRQREADGGTGPRKNAEMIEGHGRMSGELEGSTLGNSSRDSERGSRRGQQKMQGSSSFLLDSSFGSRSKTLKGGQHRHQHQHQHHHSGRSENERMEKRALPEIDNADSRRKSRFSWRRKKPSVEASSSEAGDTASRPSRDNPQPSNTDRVEEIDKVEFSQSSRPSIGLDQDSIQIVNLALDLNESRKKGNLGRSGSHRVSEGAWVQGQFSANYVDSHTGGTVGPRGRAQGNRNDAHSFDEDRSREQLTTHEPLSVSKLLPNQTDDVSLPQDISENTLARVAKARRHFELFGEYLRLLPSLPPLRPQDHDSTNGGCRIYNPLQTIRNRKVRYREKCPINVEAEGWNDVGAVHEWVSNITHQYSEQSHGPLVCLRLPQLRQWQPQTSQDEDDNDDLYATTSPESMKHAPRSSSMKAHRQRFDWMVLPAELLADAAWVEDGMNKGRMMNKDGNNLYPDITELISSDANFDTSSGRQPSSSAKRVSLDVPSRPSFAEPSRVSSDYRKASRGRSRHRIQTPSSHIHSSSASTTDRRLGRPHSRARARSSSSISIDAGTSERSAFSSPLSTKLGRNSRTRPVQEDFSSPLSQSQKSPRWTSFDEKRASMSSIGSADDLRNRSTGLNSHMYPGFFPSMAINLSPPSSRSPSPSKRHFSRKMASRNERSKSKYRAVGVPEKGGKNSLDNDLSHKPISPDHAGLDHSATGGSGKVEFGPHPNQVQPVDLNEQAVDETPAPRHSGQHDSKLRGIFKGKGKLAEKVGNEVSKMGDFIMKKDHQAHSRQSSFATSATSEEADVEPETNNGKSGASKSLLRRLPPLSDDSPRQSRKELDKPAASKGQTPPKQPLASPVKEDNDDGGGALDLQSPRESGSALQPWDAKQLQGKALDETTASEPGKFDPNVSGRNLNEIFDIGPSLRKAQPQGKKRYIKDPSIPYSLTRPPVTGLAHAEATPPSSGYGKRPTISGSWTISDRSIPTLADLGIFEKREVERTRALLLSSGIKAREITRRAETVRDPPDFLQNSTEPNSATPRVIRLREFDVASQNLDRSFKKSQTQFQQSINSFPSKTASPLKSQLDDLDNLVNNSLAPRVQSMGSDAETLTVKLNTTSTLALKQLSDTLDKGVRKRRRRLRWVRRTGFVMLEWALVGMLWWVWLIVMAFKLLRGVFRGTISSIRWVLWL